MPLKVGTLTSRHRVYCEWNSDDGSSIKIDRVFPAGRIYDGE